MRIQTSLNQADGERSSADHSSVCREREAAWERFFHERKVEHFTGLAENQKHRITLRRDPPRRIDDHRLAQTPSAEAIQSAEVN